MKRKIAWLLTLVLACQALFGCGSALETAATRTAVTADTAKEKTAPTETGTPEETEETMGPVNTEPSILDGKKILFVGNSHTYYGKVVLVKSTSALTQAERSNDRGYFYQLCKSRGAKVSVTNWTFGNHNLKDLFGVCAAGRGCDGVNHADYLTDRVFDYVVLQQGGSDVSVEENLALLDEIMAFFREANPDVKFVYLVNRRSYENGYPWLAGLDAIRAKGVTVVEWGKLINDLILGEVSVPGARESYDQNTFIIRKSESDGYHPNMLTGYLTALMTYCAITGESAVGQDYSFCGNTSLNIAFDFSVFISRYYTYLDAKTNFSAVFASKSDMRGLQELVDRYLAG